MQKPQLIDRIISVILYLIIGAILGLPYTYFSDGSYIVMGSVVLFGPLLLVFIGNLLRGENWVFAGLGIRSVAVILIVLAMLPILSNLVHLITNVSVFHDERFALLLLIPLFVIVGFTRIILGCGGRLLEVVIVVPAVVLWAILSASYRASLHPRLMRYYYYIAHYIEETKLVRK